MVDKIYKVDGHLEENAFSILEDFSANPPFDCYRVTFDLGDNQTIDIIGFTLILRIYSHLATRGIKVRILTESQDIIKRITELGVGQLLA